MATAVGLYQADSDEQLAGLLRTVSLSDWMHVGVTALEPNTHDPALTRAPSLDGSKRAVMSAANHDCDVIVLGAEAPKEHRAAALAAVGWLRESLSAVRALTAPSGRRPPTAAALTHC